MAAALHGPRDGRHILIPMLRRGGELTGGFGPECADKARSGGRGSGMPPRRASADSRTGSRGLGFATKIRPPPASVPGVAVKGYKF